MDSEIRKSASCAGVGGVLTLGKKLRGDSSLTAFEASVGVKG